jgi:hypothetical protein
MAQPGPRLKTAAERITMTGQPEEFDPQLTPRAAAGLRSLGHPNSLARAYDF